jgi:hypothetical protein
MVSVKASNPAFLGHPGAIYHVKAAFSRITLCVIMFVVAGTGRAQLSNGDFATGDLTGWCISNTVGPMTEYGLETGGTRVAQVVLFDTAGTGRPVNSASFQVGQTGGSIGDYDYPEGIIMYQYVSLNPGWLTMSLDIAAYSGSRNGDAGRFQLLLDGNVVASY